MVSRDSAKPWMDLLSPSDIAHIAKLHGRNVPDPGPRTRRQFEAMSTSEQSRYKRDRFAYAAEIPIRQLASRMRLYEELADERDQDIAAGRHRSGAHPVSVINGHAGVGKSAILDTELAETMQLAARYRWEDSASARRTRRTSTSTAGYEPIWRPAVKYEATSGTTVLGIIEGLMTKLRRPLGRKNPHALLTKALDESGTCLVALDEVQRINFDGKTGQHVHGFLRELSEQHCRVILGTTDARWVLDNPKRTKDSFGSATSLSRWVIRPVSALRFGELDEQREWMGVLRGFEDRLRLVGSPEPGWLHIDLAEYLWVVTEGHFNSLVRLLNQGYSRALRSGLERIDRALLERITVEPEHQVGRATRVALLDS
jgi:hypothetical protein